MMMKKFPVKHLPLDFIGLFFSMTGFIMVLLCLVGCIYDSGRGLYFLKVADSQPTANASMTAYYGWQAYCIDDINLGLNCYTDRSVMVVPFDVAISNQLNATYPRLFKDEIEQDTDLNPGANPNPPHDPKIYPASVLCLLAGATLLIFCIWKVMSRHYFDEFYTRGFLASAGAVLSLLLLILSVVMYQEAVKQLNLAFPNLVATQGPCITLIGIAFMCFSLASFVLLRGCMSIDEASTSNNEGYSAI